MDIKHIKILVIVLIVVILYLISEINKLKNKEGFNTESLSSLASMYKDGKLIVEEIETTGNIKCAGNLNTTGNLTTDGNIVGKHIKSSTDVQATNRVLATGDINAQNIIAKNNVKGKSMNCDTTVTTKDVTASNKLKGQYSEVHFIRPINGASDWDNHHKMSNIIHTIQQHAPALKTGDMCPVWYEESGHKKIPGFVSVSEHNNKVAHVSGIYKGNDIKRYRSVDNRNDLTTNDFNNKVWNR